MKKCSTIFYKESVFAITCRYIDNMFTKWDLETQKRIGSVKADNYFVVDANIRINNIKKTGLFATIKVNNLLNSKINYPTTGNSMWADKRTFDYGISLYFGLGIKFN
jgi:hypothetical protein